MKCCNRECATRFCPHCGKQIGEPHDLTGLLNHINRVLKTYKSRLRRGRDCMRSSDLEATIQKWESWHAKLSLLLGFKDVGESHLTSEESVEAIGDAE